MDQDGTAEAERDLGVLTKESSLGAVTYVSGHIGPQALVFIVPFRKNKPSCDTLFQMQRLRLEGVKQPMSDSWRWLSQTQKAVSGVSHSPRAVWV